jgi:hypothetical protein
MVNKIMDHQRKGNIYGLNLHLGDTYIERHIMSLGVFGSAVSCEKAAVR